MGGLDLPVKLRRGLGQGNVVPAAELTQRLTAFDTDKDGSLTRPELAEFLAKGLVGGPWFCQVVAKTLWKYVEQRLGNAQPTISADLLGRIINFAMSRGPKPDRRYEITPEGMAGYKPLEPLKRPEPAPSSGDGAKPRATPRGPGVAPSRSTSTTPGRGGPMTTRPSARPSRPIPRRPGPRR